MSNRLDKIIQTRPFEITTEHLAKGTPLGKEFGNTIQFLSDEKLILNQSIGGIAGSLIGILMIFFLVGVPRIAENNRIIEKVEEAKSECLGEISYRDSRGRLEEKPYYKRKIKFTYEARQFMQLGEEGYRAVVAKHEREALFVYIYG